MANEAQISFVGNTTDVPHLNFTKTGTAVANFTVAVTPRVKDGDQWKDGETAYYRVAAWKKLAENVAGSVRKGDRVSVTGRLAPNTTERDGKTYQNLDVNADTVGLEVTFKTASFGESANRQPVAAGAPSLPADDPWAVPPTNANPPF